MHFNEVSAAHVSTTLHRQQALDVHLHQRQFLAAAESLVALEARLAHLQEQADNALALQAAHQQQQQQPDGSTSSSEALDAVAGAAPLSRLVGLCANQTKVCPFFLNLSSFNACFNFSFLSFIIVRCGVLS